MILRDNFLIIVVLYNQDLFSCNTYKTLLKNCNNPVFIYDNSREPITDTDKLPLSWHYVYNPLNPGLSHAYNEGAAYAATIGCNWLFIADQDTTFDSQILKFYTEIIDTQKDVGIISPLVVTDNNETISPVKNSILPANKKITFKSDTKYNLRKYFPINSGILVNLDLYVKAGGYNDKVFLDYSDFEFCRRLSKIKDTFYLSKAKCIQSFSNDEQNNEIVFSRFKLFCNSVKNCTRTSMREQFFLNAIILKRALSLAIRFKTLLPFKIAYLNYLK